MSEEIVIQMSFLGLIIVVVAYKMAFLLLHQKRNNMADIYNAGKDGKLFQKVKVYFCSQYLESEFENEDEKKWAKDDCSSFSSYDLAIEQKNELFSEYDVKCLDIIKLKRPNQQEKNPIATYLYSFEEEEIEIGSRYSSDTYSHKYCLNCCLLTEISSRKRLHIMCNENISNDLEYKSFEEIFIDQKDYVKNFDKKFGEKYSYVYTNQYHDEDFMNKGQCEYLELSKQQQVMLSKLYNDNRLCFSIILENGILRVKIKLGKKDIEEHLKTGIEQRINNILIRSLEEFTRV